MTRQFSKLWLVVLLATVAFTSCHKNDRTEPNSPVEVQGETVTLSLSAEVGFEEEAPKEGDLKGLNFKIENVNGKRIPRPQFKDGDSVDVHTVLCNEAGTVVVAKTLKWKYEANRRKLLLKQTSVGNSFSVSNFNNNGGVKWYIAGLLAPGTVLSGSGSTQVQFTGTRQLRGVSGNVDEELGELNVPYWFGWRELKMETGKAKDGTSYRYAAAADTAGKFKPLGSLIAYKFGNKINLGSPKFTPTGFTVTSNAFGDKGTFDLNSGAALPSTNPQNELPKWTPTAEPMSYTFAASYTAPTMNYNTLAENADKRYYTWVMPTGSSNPAKTRVSIKGKKDAATTATTFPSDYRPSTSGSQGKPKPGKISTLTANALRWLLPIDYVTEYNLAGGAGLTYTTTNMSPQPDGVQGNLRFANRTSSGGVNPINPHRNDQSGYYNCYKLMGRYNATYNNSTKNLQGNDVMVIDTDGTSRKLTDHYFVPEQDHWWGVFPCRASFNWAGSNTHIFQEYFQFSYVTSDSGRQLLWGNCQYTAGTAVGDNTVVYAIRFAAPSSGVAPHTENWLYDLSTYTYKSRTYQPLPDNSLRCAYRFTRVGSTTAWDKTNNSELNTQLRIDVVHLGDADFKEAGKTELQTISDPLWWSTRASETIARSFPATGYIAPSSSAVGSLSRRGHWAPFWSASPYLGEYAWYVSASKSEVGGNAISNSDGFSVRLFKKDPTVQ